MYWIFSGSVRDLQVEFVRTGERPGKRGGGEGMERKRVEQQRRNGERDEPLCTALNIDESIVSWVSWRVVYAVSI